jgi:hypothetical protein
MGEIVPKSLRSYHAVFALAILITANVPAVAQQGWQYRYFPPPNGGWLAFTIIDGNPACASYNGSACLWGQARNQIRFDRVEPLVCGADHRAKWGVTGYEDTKHWCNLARGGKPVRRLGRPRQSIGPPQIID